MAVDPARAKSLFLAASSLQDRTARAAYLDEACGGDAALRQRVEALLGADDGVEPPGAGNEETVPGHPPAASPDATEVVDNPTHASAALAATQAGSAGTDATVADHPGDVGRVSNGLGRVIAGRYTLVGVLGEGGMGTVYRADQAAPVKRQVALKLIKVGMDSRVVLARFDAERRALALMDHPNIARVYDGGTTDTGQPFFVMELVNGEPITDYCDRLRLPVRTRLELFVTVCQAVQHAHQKGIIHRDLKPSNVMVTEVDGRAMPKVIDFGVAKATEFNLTDLSLGDTGAIVGTPAYMSPEQADPSSMDIDTRTDIYALGVILYELLAGSPPIDAKQFQRGAILEMLRMVREYEPPKPSTKVSTADALPSISASRDAEPAHLKRALKGDLDWIVMRALEKDRRRRYETANGFAADIQRHLASEPVTAAPPSRAYRVRKFMRKYRGEVTAASLLLFALLAGIAGTTWGLFEARRQEAAANHYAGEAQAQAKVAGDNAKRADAEAQAARRAEKEARDREAAEAAAKALAQQETRRAEAERARTLVQLTRAEGLLYSGKLAEAQNNFEAGNGGLALHYLDQCQVGLRGWEYRYLWSRVNARQTLVGHAGEVTSVAFSPDGKRILTASYDGTAKVWDAATGQQILTLKGHTMWVISAAFSADGRRIVTGAGEYGIVGKPTRSEAKVWDAATGRELLVLSVRQSPVWSVAFSPDGQRIVTCAADWGDAAPPAAEVKVWDAATGREILAIPGLTGDVRCVAYSPDGQRIATGGDPAKSWDAATGEELFTFPGVASSMTYSPDGKHLLVGRHDRTARVWDAEKGDEILVLKGHASAVECVAYSPDGLRIVTGSWDQTTKVWDAATGRELRVIKGHAGFVRGVAFSPDGQRIVTCSDDALAKVWDAEKGQEVPALKGHGDFVRGIAYSPDGLRIATASGDGTAKLWDAATSREILTFRGHTDPTVAVAYSPDGKRIVTGSKDKTARVWDVETGREILALKAHKDEVWGVAYSPDGRRIATCGVDRTVKVWDAATGAEILTLKGHTGVVWGVTFSPDGKHLVSGGSDGMARVWDAATGREIRTIDGRTEGVLSVAYSPDGRR
ncbi:MAG: protein kinase, partial [Isosphaeraceae bacterium]